MTIESRVGETTVKKTIVEEAEILVKLATPFRDTESHFGKAAYVFRCHIYREAWGQGRCYR